MGFPKHIIDQVHNQVKRKVFCHAPQAVQDENRPPTISLPNNQFVVDYIRPILHAHEYKVVNHSSSTLKTRLVRNKPVGVVDEGAGPGVYSIPCNNCDKVYYGETGRNFSTRLNEHKAAVRLGHNNNACFKHVWENNSHSINWGESKLIYPSTNHYERLVVESTCILGCPEKNFSYIN